ncbi:hypothetical protein HOLleu_20537 [Holothuria leucospilota]|uniref:Uncharacterized protein n=1 Tax=Holothuria leucospilota TaxID=206669 RepID=A0A9Q1C1Y8_HOLLE|nr:hypothetical protein HOLleu_20537 [Holothuria leucospilota]
MDKIRTPDRFDFESPKLATRWQHWKEEFWLYAELAMEGKDDKVKAKMCLYLMGTKGREIYDTLKPAGAAGNSQPVGEALTISDGYCNQASKWSITEI